MPTIRFQSRTVAGSPSARSNNFDLCWRLCAAVNSVALQQRLNLVELGHFRQPAMFAAMSHQGAGSKIES